MEPIKYMKWNIFWGKFVNTNLFFYAELVFHMKEQIINNTLNQWIVAFIAEDIRDYWDYATKWRCAKW